MPIPLWSLAVEEHFYLLFPALYLVLARTLGNKSIAGVCAALCLASVLVRVANVFVFDVIEANYFYTHTRIDSILFGCILALWQNPRMDEGAWRPGIPAVLVAVVMLLGCFTVKDEAFRETIRYTIQGISLFVIFSFVLHGNSLASAVLNCWPMQKIGLYSYTIYLIHYAMIYMWQGLVPDQNVVIVALTSGAASLAYAVFLHWAVEGRLARIRRRMNKVEAPVTDAV